MSETLADLGEFGVIGRLLERLPIEGAAVEIGPGRDDAAVLRVGDRQLLATADLSIEGRHFDLGFSSPADAGWKAMTVNISDIAAMGGRPLWALVSLGAPPSTPVDVLEQLADGLAAAARAHGVLVVGGDTVGAEQLVVSVALLGEPGEAGVVTRGGAREGDVLCVTGTLGGAAAGLTLLRAASGGDPEASALLERFPDLARAHRRPVARVREGQAAAAAGARAMIDVSDGLLQDANARLTEASEGGVSVVVDERLVPAMPGVAEAEAWLRARDAGSPSGPFLAQRGGDDYELAIVVPVDVVGSVADAIAPTPLTRIGAATRFFASRQDGGWDSFRGSS